MQRQTKSACKAGAGFVVFALFIFILELAILSHPHHSAFLRSSSSDAASVTPLRSLSLVAAKLPASPSKSHSALRAKLFRQCDTQNTGRLSLAMVREGLHTFLVNNDNDFNVDEALASAFRAATAISKGTELTRRGFRLLLLYLQQHLNLAPVFPNIALTVAMAARSNGENSLRGSRKKHLVAVPPLSAWVPRGAFERAIPRLQEKGIEVTDISQVFGDDDDQKTFHDICIWALKTRLMEEILADIDTPSVSKKEEEKDNRIEDAGGMGEDATVLPMSLAASPAPEQPLSRQRLARINIINSSAAPPPPLSPPPPPPIMSLEEALAYESIIAPTAAEEEGGRGGEKKIARKAPPSVASAVTAALTPATTNTPTHVLNSEFRGVGDGNHRVDLETMTPNRNNYQQHSPPRRSSQDLIEYERDLRMVAAKTDEVALAKQQINRLSAEVGELRRKYAHESSQSKSLSSALDRATNQRLLLSETMRNCSDKIVEVELQNQDLISKLRAREEEILKLKNEREIDKNTIIELQATHVHLQALRNRTKHELNARTLEFEATKKMLEDAEERCHRENDLYKVAAGDLEASQKVLKRMRLAKEKQAMQGNQVGVNLSRIKDGLNQVASDFQLFLGSMQGSSTHSGDSVTNTTQKGNQVVLVEK